MKVLYIYKLDSNDQPPISTLYIGEHTIGRGDLLKCNDNRVSRNHGIINVSNDTATITSTHQNPCFYQSVNSSTITILPKNVSIDINDGDKFALLADQFWFKINIKDSPNLNICDENHIEQVKDEENVSAKRSYVNAIDLANKRIKIDNENNLGRELIASTSQTNSKFSATSETDYDAKLKAMLFSSDEEDDENVLPDNDKSSINNNEIIDQVNNSNNNEDNSKIQNSNIATTSGTKIDATRPWRDRCWYGPVCYRKNSSHLKKYSHPNDSDYATDPEDNRRMCAFGSSCFRRNKDHRRAYKHPSNMKNPTQKGFTNKRRVVPPNYKDSSDDEDELKDPFKTDGNSSADSEYEANLDDESDSDGDSTEEEEIS